MKEEHIRSKKAGAEEEDEEGAEQKAQCCLGHSETFTDKPAQC